MPTDAKYRVFKSREEMREHYGYGKGGYWVTYVDDTAYTDHVEEDESGYITNVLGGHTGIGQLLKKEMEARNA